LVVGALAGDLQTSEPAQLERNFNRATADIGVV
jgi:hypothetical protein